MTGVSNDPRKYSYIREENGIVYMGIGANTQPIYDFSLQKDDTAYWGQYVIAGIDIIDKYVYVKDVSYSQIAGKERKVLNVEICAKSLNGNNDDKKHTETWIEGIGATTDVFTAERMRWDYELTGPSNSWAYYYNYSTQTSYPDDARLYSFATQPEHEYIPLLSPSSEWVELAYKAYVRYAISDTTTMNSKEYCVISGTEMWLPEKEIHSSNSKLYVREEGKRVYLYDEYAPDKEELLFDFGAKAGDRIVVSDDANNSRVIAINSVETITLDGKERNLLHVSYIYNESIDTNDTWIEGIGPTQSFLFNNIIRWGGSGYSYFHYFYDNNTEFIYPEESEVIDFDPQPQHEYLPTCVAGREYFYVNNSDTLKINTQPSQKKEGYIIFDCNNNDSPPYSTILKDFNSQIHRNYDDMSFSDGVLVKFKENFKTFDNDVVYFDYDLQVGDTLSVIYFMNTGLGYYESHKIYGKIINVLSIDTTMLQSRKHLRYMLRSIDFEASLWTDFDERPDGPPINYRYNYKIVKIGEPYNDAWIEGIGYTRYSGIYTMSNNKAGTLQCVFEKGELIYCAEGANCDGLSDNANEKIDITTLTLHREGDVLVAVFPVVGAGEAITLYDATGRVVASQPLRQGATTATIDISHLPQGIYIAHMDNGASCKVVL